MSGYEVCLSLRSDERTSLLPVVLVTALDAVEERVKMYSFIQDAVMCDQVSGVAGHEQQPDHFE